MPYQLLGSPKENGQKQRLTSCLNRRPAGEDESQPRQLNQQTTNQAVQRQGCTLIVSKSDTRLLKAFSPGLRSAEGQENRGDACRSQRRRQGWHELPAAVAGRRRPLLWRAAGGRRAALRARGGPPGLQTGYRCFDWRRCRPASTRRAPKAPATSLFADNSHASPSAQRHSLERRMRFETGVISQAVHGIF